MLSTLCNIGKVFERFDGDANQVTRTVYSYDEQMKKYERFPEVICIGLIYNTNRGMFVKVLWFSNVISCKLFQLVTTNNCGHGTPDVFAWTKVEKKDVV